MGLRDGPRSVPSRCLSRHRGRSRTIRQTQRCTWVSTVYSMPNLDSQRPPGSVQMSKDRNTKRFHPLCTSCQAACGTRSTASDLLIRWAKHPLIQFCLHPPWATSEHNTCLSLRNKRTGIYHYSDKNLCQSSDDQSGFDP